MYKIRYGKDDLLRIRNEVNETMDIPKVFEENKDCFDENSLRNYSINQESLFFSWNPMIYWNKCRTKRSIVCDEKFVTKRRNRSFDKSKANDPSKIESIKHDSAEEFHSQLNAMQNSSPIVEDKQSKSKLKASDIYEMAQKAASLSEQLFSLYDQLKELKIDEVIFCLIFFSKNFFFKIFYSFKLPKLNDSRSSGYLSTHSDSSMIMEHCQSSIIEETSQSSSQTSSSSNNSGESAEYCKKLPSKDEIIENVRKVYQNALIRNQLEIKRKALRPLNNQYRLFHPMSSTPYSQLDVIKQQVNFNFNTTPILNANKLKK